MKNYFFILCFAITQSLHCQNLDGAPDPKRIHYVPQTFSNSFKLDIQPVVNLNPGDTLMTETLDAAGFDKNGIKRQKGGNPLTGPFYIRDSKAGDVLAITLRRVSLNRSTAFTTEGLSSRSVPKAILEQIPKNPPRVKWNLDRDNGIATLDSPYEHLKNFNVPLHPFLGCIGVAPEGERADILSFFQGTFGGNLDFSGITAGATVYLPVFHDGAALYIGDGHAEQGDGELAGNALETSMAVELIVRLVKNDTLKLIYPRVEDAVYMMNFGIDKSLDNAIKIATSGLLDWLQSRYHLSLQECTQVLSTSVEYSIAEIVDPQVEVVAKIKKEVLKGISDHK